MSKNYQELSVEELKSEVLSLRKEQLNLRMQRATGQSPRSHLFGELKKKIAQANTFITAKLKATRTKDQSEK